MQHEHEPIVCPSCNAKLNCSTNIISEDPPDPGDMSICCYCGDLLVYTENRELRMATEADRATLNEEEAFLIKTVQAKIRGKIL